MNDLKLTMAKDFINSIREGDPENLTKLLRDTAGEDVAKFFQNYSTLLISQCAGPEEAISNCSGLMLLGYLIRANEEKLPVLSGATQMKALA